MVSAQIHGFEENAQHAIQTSPKYFLWWYSAKSIGLGVAVGIIGFLIGRAVRK